MCLRWTCSRISHCYKACKVWCISSVTKAELFFFHVNWKSAVILLSLLCTRNPCRNVKIHMHWQCNCQAWMLWSISKRKRLYINTGGEVAHLWQGDAGRYSGVMQDVEGSTLCKEGLKSVSCLPSPYRKSTSSSKWWAVTQAAVMSGSLAMVRDLKSFCRRSCFPSGGFST